MNEDKIKLEPGWKALLKDEFQKPYMEGLRGFLKSQMASNKTIYPSMQNVFAALNMTPFDQVKVVILGQDPYHGLGQAHGLCFSVLPGIDIPPSLHNIYREIERELGIHQPPHGFLGWWAEQGVLLLNATLTVEKGKAGSHQGKGWEQFTDRIIAILNERQKNLVFVLWGSYAQKKGQIIDRTRHLVLESPHPSPLSAHRGFFGCGHFKKINDYLLQHGERPIDWQLPPLEYVRSTPLDLRAMTR